MDWNVKKLLYHLEAHDECQRIEAKSAKSKIGSSILETISAFANEPGLFGGYLVLGLCPQPSDHLLRYKVQGVDHPDHIQQEIVGVCRNNFNVQISPEIAVHEVDGKTLLVVYISEVSAQEKPIYIKARGVERGSFRRIGSADYRCSSEDLDLFYQLKSITI